MSFNFVFFLNSLLLGIGLAMDAFSVSVANGLKDYQMSRKKICLIAGTFAFFQALMPLLGWFCVHSLIQYFCTFEKIVPWISLFLLLFLGIKMIYEGRKNNSEQNEDISSLTFSTLILQGIATSIDALSVGFTISEYNFLMALIAASIIALVTFIICFIGIYIGKKVGTKLSNKATIFGGAILIFIGIEIFISSFFK